MGVVFNDPAWEEPDRSTPGAREEEKILADRLIQVLAYAAGDGGDFATVQAQIVQFTIGEL